ncbi:hypothetical protein RM69_03820 [Mesotoga sp. SC_NapDC3]|nr:hypothetical protein RM69_03820 [Mesotoga sp. SC_NapDC3]
MTKELFAKLKRRLIVSCQARKGQPFDSPHLLSLFAKAAELGGAGGIRANTPANIEAIKNAVDLPIIGILKRHIQGREVFITPELVDAVAVAEAGADIVALDCTLREHREHEVRDIVAELRSKYQVALMADVSTLKEALFAQELGFDFVASTLVGFTSYTSHCREFSLELLRKMSNDLTVPVIAEGHIRTPEQAGEAIKAGAFAVVVGKAITMPSEITKWFVDEIKSSH